MWGGGWFGFVWLWMLFLFGFFLTWKCSGICDFTPIKFSEENLNAAVLLARSFYSLP